METNVTSGMAITFANAPYTPARWKWNSTIGISASSITRPVTSSASAPRASFAASPSSRRANSARTGSAPWSAAIARTAAKLIWKLGPTIDSGHSSSTNAPATATSRSEIGSRPRASAPSTSTAPTQLRTVGTSAPVSRVYAIPASAPTPAATTGSRTRKASHGHSASSLIASR